MRIPPAPHCRIVWTWKRLVTRETSYTCNGLTLFNPQDFYSKYPFAALSSTVLKTDVYSKFVSVHGKLYSTECFTQGFRLLHPSKTVCGSCKPLFSLNRVKGIIDRVDFRYEENKSLRKLNNHFLTPRQLIEKIQHQEKTMSEMKPLTFNLQKNNVLSKRFPTTKDF